MWQIKQTCLAPMHINNFSHQPETNMNTEEMKKLEKDARELILAIAEKTLKTLKDNGLLKEPSSLQKLSFSNPEIRAFLEKFKGPKYDPCRPFRKGDIVEPCQVKGRWLSEAWKDRAGIRFIVTMSEDADGRMLVKDPDSIIDRYADAVYFQLVTPVEELEPYYVKDDGTHYVVGKRPEEPEIVYLAEYSKDRHPHAKEAAQAECDRLNAEYRKEQE
jgi:hypothetical protein